MTRRRERLAEPAGGALLWDSSSGAEGRGKGRRGCMLCQGGCDMVSPAWGLGTEIYFLTVLEAGSQGWRCRQGSFLLRPRSLVCKRPASSEPFTGSSLYEHLCPNLLFL